MADTESPLRAAIRAIEIQPPSSFLWFGNRSLRLLPSLKRQLTPQAERALLHHAVQGRLYQDFYCSGRPRPGTRTDTATVLGENEFIERLSNTNCGTGFWSTGWTIRATEAETIAVRQNGLELLVRRDDCLEDGSTPLGPGAPVRLRHPKELLGASPGFYMALGNMALESSTPLIRFYLHATADGAVRLVEVLTAVLNDAELPFRLKVVNCPARFDRCDAMVLYVHRSDYRIAVDVVAGCFADLDAHLVAGTPAFTKPLAPGLAIAEDPTPGQGEGSGTSFGLNRCALLAEGLIRASARRLPEAGKLHAVRECFAEAGIDLDMPYLNPGSSDSYEFRWPRRARAVHARERTCRDAPDTSAYYRVACELGERLVREAVWHADRCTWLGALPTAKFHGEGRGVSYRSIGPDLYSGTSGISLFLAELFAATGDEHVGRAARGSMRQALATVEAIPDQVRLGAYTGWPGIAIAATATGPVLGAEDLPQAALDLLKRATSIEHDEQELDLLSGVAGAVLAALVLHDARHEPTLLAMAVRLGDRLLRLANRTDSGYSWSSMRTAGGCDLTGFSHGAAGIAHALLELSCATDESRYADAAERAFRYERQWYEPATGNWADLRGHRPGRRDRHPRTAGSTWCHGAPGIALSRMRAFEILRDETYRAETLAAAATTGRAIEEWLGTRSANFSLCHGLAGNAEVLLCVDGVAAKPRAAMPGLAIAVAERGLDAYASHEHRWPCGTGAGETPGLMLGLAGIGHFYLRMSGRALFSPLCLRGSPKLEAAS